MSTSFPHGDWTSGHPVLRYQACTACQQRWYFARPFCPRCGHALPESHVASGRGTVYALTAVTRAPGDAWQSLAPYTIVLVDAEEGFRLMGHGDAGLAIGDPVAGRFITNGDRVLPYFSAV